MSIKYYQDDHYFKENNFNLKLLGSLLIALSGLILFIDKFFNFELENNFGFKNTDAFIWVLCQTLSPILMLLASLFKPYKLSYTVPIYIYSIQFYWIFDPKIQFDDFFLQAYAIGAILGYLILSDILLKINRIRKEKLEKETKFKYNALLTIESLKKEIISRKEEERNNERKRISQELHDGILGKLFGIRMNLGFIEPLDDTNTIKHKKFLKELQKVEEDIRSLSHKLNINISGKQDIAFNIIIEQFLREKSLIGNFSYNLKNDSNINWGNLDEEIKIDIYRIFQESLHNIIKYSFAKHVYVKIQKINEYIDIEIKDNGIGFNTNKSKNGIGLKNMESRVKRNNGFFEIISVPNEGTSLNISIPVYHRH